jgi:hypothetical protein
MIGTMVGKEIKGGKKNVHMITILNLEKVDVTLIY